MKGEKLILHFDRESIDRKTMLMLLANSIQVKLTDMIFCYDLETTGLIEDDINFPDIVERYVEDYTNGITWSAGLIKLQTKNKLDSIITEITGISNDELNAHGTDIETMKRDFQKIFSLCENPIFIAHNGNRFDHRIMKYYNLFHDDTRTLDSLIFLRLFVNKQDSKTYKLVDIFNHYVNEHITAHRAQADVYMMLKIFEKLGMDYKTIKGLV